MTRSVLTGAILAGFAAGLLAALLHFAFVQTLILEAERYETGEAVHFDGLADAADAEPVHDHDAAATEEHTDHSHSHDAEEGAETSPLARNALTVLFFALTYAGYGLILSAGITIAAGLGHATSATQGILWGLAGYASFHLAPALGLAPELPGTVAADLTARQIWWTGTALATAFGLGLLAFGRGIAAPVAAIALLALPHLIGAPEPQGYSGIAPPELASSFAARSLGTGLIVWLALGWLVVRLRRPTL